MAEPNLEKATQQNTNKQNTKRQSTNLSGQTGESADFDQMEAQVGEYQLPRLTLPQTDEAEPLGKYGRMRLAYLKNHRPVLYNQMLLNGTLWPHLQDVQKTACMWLERTVAGLL